MQDRRKYVRTVTLLMLTGLLLAAGCQKYQKESGQEKLLAEKPQAEMTIAQTEGKVPETTPYVPVVSLDIRETESYAEEEEQLLVSGYCELPVLIPTAEGDENRELQEALEAWTTEQETAFRNTAEQYETDAQEQWEAMREMLEARGEEFYGYSTESRIQYTRVDSAVLSFLQNYSDYTGGPHGNYGYSGVTFDVKTGKHLEISELLKEDADFSAFYGKVTDYCIREANTRYEEEEISGDYETAIREKTGPDMNWYLDAAGITVVFNPYEIGPYAIGPVFVHLPYEDFSEMLKPEYQGFAGTGTAEFPVDTLVQVKLSDENHTAQTLKLWIEQGETEEGIWNSAVRIQTGEEEVQLEYAERIGSAYLIRKENNRLYLLFDADMASDDYITYSYEIMDGKIRKADETAVGCSIAPGYVNTDRMKLNVRIDLLGTYGSDTDYRFTDEGKLEKDSSLYELKNTSPWAVITTIRELPVTMEGKETFLPAGSRICMTATDLNGTIWFRDKETGREGEIHYTIDENSGWPVYIDGIEEQEYFEMLPYAG